MKKWMILLLVVAIFATPMVFAAPKPGHEGEPTDPDSVPIDPEGEPTDPDGTYPTSGEPTDPDSPVGPSLLERFVELMTSVVFVPIQMS